MFESVYNKSLDLYNTRTFLSSIRPQLMIGFYSFSPLSPKPKSRPFPDLARKGNNSRPFLGLHRVWIFFSSGMTHSFFELFLHFDQKWSTTLACLFFREIGFSESLIFLAKIKKIQGASKPTGWKFVNLAHFGGNWITKLANFRPKILFFWPFSFSQK